MSSNWNKLEIPPGVVATATKQMASSNWSEVNLVRWIEGQMSPVGGQAAYSYSFASRCRAIHGWFGLDQAYHIAYLCESNLYVDTGGTLTEITPPGGLGTPPADVTPVGPGYGAGIYSAEEYGTPRSAGTPPPAIPIANLPAVYSLDNFGAILYAMTSFDTRLLAWDPAAGTPGIADTLATGAAFTAASPNITMAVANPGTVTAGMNVFNSTGNTLVGTVLTYSGTALVLTANALFPGASGDSLIFSTNLALEQTGAPRGRCFVVTPERFIQIFGMFNDGTADGGSARRFGWCDQENPASWSFSDVTSQAGYLDVEPASPIVCALATRHGTLFWTAKMCFISQFVGLPYVYNYAWLADNVTPWSPESMTTTSIMAMWMSQQGMLAFDGTNVDPIPCAVRAWINEDIDLTNVREQACAVHVAPFSEFWWFFPQNGQPNNTRAVIFNYKEGWWSQGQMSRSAGITASYTTNTIMADGTAAYQHEIGNVYPSDVPLPWAETFDLNLVPNGNLITIKQLLPDIGVLNTNDPYDIAAAIGTLRYSLFYRNSRSLGSPEQQTQPRSVRVDGYVDFRVTGRDIRMKIEVQGSQVLPFTVGQHLVDGVPRGDR
jgi:hypothetical protein